MTINWDRNAKQRLLLETAVQAARGQTPVREISYGGGQRGGKTFGTLGVLVLLCRMFPSSRWYIFRDTFAAHKTKTIPSLEKIIMGLTTWRWNRDSSNYYAEYENGSRIIFAGENKEVDPEFGFLLGLECNGIVLEQTEDISERFYKASKARLGSWIIDPMPTPLMFMTFNPTQNWTKKLIYLPWRNNLLAPYQAFIEALPDDNPWNTADQWETWSRLDPKTQRQMIQGDWTDLTDKDNLWAYAFDREKHVAKDADKHPEIWNGNKEEFLYLSFDFNRNPMCCSVIQHYNDTIYILQTYKIRNSNIYDLCDHIKAEWGDEFLLQVTGDATGQSSTAMVEDNLNYYRIIASKLDLAPACFKLTSVNPKQKDNRVLVNSVLSRYKVQIHPVKCEDSLIYDLENVKMYADGSIVKADRNDPAQQADALDTFRYWLNVYMRRFVTQVEE